MIKFSEWVQDRENILSEDIIAELTEQEFKEFVGPIIAAGGALVRGIFMGVTGLVQAGLVATRIAAKLTALLAQAVKVTAPPIISSLWKVLVAAVKGGIFTGEIILKILNFLWPMIRSGSVSVIKFVTKVLISLTKFGSKLTWNLIESALVYAISKFEGKETEDVDIPEDIKSQIDNIAVS